MFGTALLLGMFHFASSESIQANICGLPDAPVITSPTAPVDTSTQELSIIGTATPNTTVSLLDNSTLAASLTSDGSGNFAGTVELVSGSNSIVAQVGNNCNQTAASTVVTATYTPPPPPPPPKKPVVVVPAPAVVAVTPTNNTPTVFIPIVTTPTQTLSGQGLKLQVTSTDTSTSPDQTPATKTVSSASVYVSGTTGVAANIAVVVNGKVVADIVSGSDGKFNILVPLSVGKNKIQLIATLGNKTVTRNLSYKRTASVVGAGTAMMITYIGTSVTILVLIGLILLSLKRRKSKKEREERERMNQHAPVHL